MRLLFAIVALGACTQPHVPSERPANACDAGAFTRSEMVLTVEAGGKQRRALVWMPPGPGPHPVVVNLHEFRSNPRQHMRYSGWADNIKDSNAIVVAPDGKYAVWNAGDCCGRAVDKHVNDVVYLDAIIDKLNEVACLDGQVLATGIGNGAMLAHMWSCESNKPTAVVSVGGSLQWKECRNDTPIPWLHYHGDQDPFIPMDGSPKGLVKQEKMKWNLDHAVTSWKARNQITAEKTVAVGDLRCTEYAGVAPASVCIVEGGKDTWPGAPDGIVDTSSALGNATRGAWAWVRQQWSNNG